MLRREQVRRDQGSAEGVDGGYFALRGDLLCPRRQSRQNATGGMARRESISALPHAFPRQPPDPHLRGTRFCFLEQASGAQNQDYPYYYIRCRSNCKFDGTLSI